MGSHGHRSQKLLALKLGCHGVPLAIGQQPGVPRSADLCPHCHDGSVGDGV